MNAAGKVDLAAVGGAIAELRRERDLAQSCLDRLLLAVEEAERTGATVIRLGEIRAALAEIAAREPS